MRWLALSLLALSSLLPYGVSAQATLNKCIDAQGKVTYSNLPCRNAKEVRKVEIDPAPEPVRPQRVQTQAAPVPVTPPPAPAPVAPVPPPAPVAPVPPPVQVAPPAPPVPVIPVPPKVPAAPAAAKAPAIAIEPAPKRIEARPSAVKPAAPASASQCDALTEQLGRVLDKMDAARRVGATQEQVNTWNEEVKELERKKQQSGCF